MLLLARLTQREIIPAESNAMIDISETRAGATIEKKGLLYYIVVSCSHWQEHSSIDAPFHYICNKFQPI